MGTLLGNIITFIAQLGNFLGDLDNFVSNGTAYFTNGLFSLAQGIYTWTRKVAAWLLDLVSGWWDTYLLPALAAAKGTMAAFASFWQFILSGLLSVLHGTAVDALARVSTMFEQAAIGLDTVRGVFVTVRGFVLGWVAALEDVLYTAGLAAFQGFERARGKVDFLVQWTNYLVTVDGLLRRGVLLTAADVYAVQLVNTVVHAGRDEDPRPAFLALVTEFPLLTVDQNVERAGAWSTGPAPRVDGAIELLKELTGVT